MEELKKMTPKGLEKLPAEKHVAPQSLSLNMPMKIIQAIIAFFKGRLKEDSSYGALAAILAYLGVRPEGASVIMDAAVSLSALIAFLIQQKSKKDANSEG